MPSSAAERIVAMLPTFVIGLREGLEAALIVGIIAAFLRKQGRRDLLGWVLGGVTIAILLCLGAGIALQAYSRDLPQKQQEGLETVIGALAVGMVTYMVVWMRRNSRNLKGQLEGLAAEAIGGRSNAGRALVLMAFLAVIREGVETVVFVLAAFNEAANGTTAGFGLLLGIALAIALGYGIYRGGVRLNLSKFFRATGIVLVFVAAGIVVNALHTAHEAGWINVGQGSTVNLTWLVNPGSVQSSLLTGMLGLQPYPVTIEVIGWLVYLIPVGLYVAWPPGRAVPRRGVAVGSALVAGPAAIGALLAVVLVPSAPAGHPVTSGGDVAAAVTSRSGDVAILSVTSQRPIAGTSGARTDVRFSRVGPVEHAGAESILYRATVPGSGTAGRPSTLTLQQAAALNGNQLPIGLGGTGQRISATYRDTTTASVWLDRSTDRVLDIAWSETVTATLTSGSRTVPLDTPVAARTVALPAAARSAALDAAVKAHDRNDSRSSLRSLALWLAVLAVVAAISAAGFWTSHRRRQPAPGAQTPTASELVRS